MCHREAQEGHQTQWNSSGVRKRFREAWLASKIKQEMAKSTRAGRWAREEASGKTQV